MKKIFLTATLITMISMAHAKSLNFQFSGLSGIIDGSNRIFISQTVDGKLNIRSTNGEETIEITVIADNRALDGDLELDLGKGRVMIVTSGFAPDGKIQYILQIGSEKIELNPIVYLNLK